MTPLSDVLARRHLPALDGMRGAFVLVVMLYHAGLPVPGDLGVTAFFVLSGFLITWLLLKEHDREGTISYRGFYMRRSLRIFPAYFAFLGLTIGADYVLGAFERNWGPVELISAFTYTVNYNNAFSGHTHPTAHAWSLAVEEQFYLMWPFAFSFLVSRQLLVRGLVWIIGAVLAWRTFLFIALNVGSHYVYNAFETRFDAIAIGCLVAALCSNREFPRRVARVARRAWYPLPVLAALYVSRVHLGAMWHYSIGFTVDSALIAVMMLQLMQLSSTPWWKWLDSRFAVWIGVLSYPLYLWHLWGIGSADNLLGSFGAYPLQFVVGLLLSFFLAACSYYVIEKPFLKLKAVLGRNGHAASAVRTVAAQTSTT